MDEVMNPKERVLLKIKEKILKQEWTPGMKISSENQLAKELEVSRMSVREAMEQLVALNVLVKNQGEGTFVNNLSPSIYLNSLLHMTLLERDDMLDMLEFRKILEVDSIRLCAQRCTDEDLVALEECYQNMVTYQNDPEQFYRADSAFHTAIVDGTHNSFIIKVNQILNDLLLFHQQKIHEYLGPQGGLKEHKQILEAVKNRDCEMASLFMRRHIERTIAEIQNID